MIFKTDRKIITAILILLATGLLLSACGKKAPPQPPAREAAPAEIGHLSKTISGNTLRLTWSLIAGKDGDVAGFYVYRSKTLAADLNCRTCPVVFIRVAVIPYQGQGKGGSDPRPFEYQETLEDGYRYIYKVAAYSRSGLTGKDSKTVEFDHKKSTLPP